MSIYDDGLRSWPDRTDAIDEETQPRSRPGLVMFDLEALFADALAPQPEAIRFERVRPQQLL